MTARPALVLACVLLALGAVTQFGGAAFIAGWLGLAWTAWRGA